MKRLFLYLRGNKWVWLAIGAIITVTALYFSFTMGASRISREDILKAVFFSKADNHVYNIIYLVRLPRTIACILCGGSLAVSGLLIQTALHTPLASPGIIGVNAGAGFAVVLTYVLFPAAFIPRIIGAFLGALVTVMIVYAIASKSGASSLTIVLSGVAVSSLLTAFTDALITINPAAVMDRSAFSIGGFSGVGISQSVFVMPITIFSLIISLIIAKSLEILTMGDDVAASLGVRVKLIRFLSLFIAALLAACAVSIGGLIGFVGLIAPHIARLLFRTRFTGLIIFSFWFGSMLMLICDLFARTLFKPFEIPTGIALAFIGAPFFLFLLLTKRKESL